MAIDQNELFDKLGAGIEQLEQLAGSHPVTSVERQRLLAKADALNTSYHYALDTLYGVESDVAKARGVESLRTLLKTDKIDATIAMGLYKPNERETLGYAKALGTYEGLNLALDYTQVP